MKEYQLFEMYEPSSNLKSSISKMIKKEEIKKTIYKMVFSSVMSISSITVMIIFAINIITDMSQSGLYQYLSLLVSDGTALTSYWQSYVMSLVESLPIIPVSIVVASLGVFIWSINKAYYDFKNIRTFFYKYN